MPEAIDMMGQRFGMVVVIARAEPGKYRAARWVCLCDCGNTTTTAGANLRNRKDNSCGCRKNRLSAERLLTHGQSDSSEFRTWLAIIQRCHNPSATAYYKYGARGISVCDRWRSSFEAFLSDMGPKPTARHSIERNNNDGNYEPGNCRWATAIEQANNKRTTRFVEYRGERLALNDAMRKAGTTLDSHVVWARIRRGWEIERALEAPSMAARADLRELIGEKAEVV